MATIPVNDTTPRNQYTASAAQTTFDYDFIIFDEADLEVYVDGALQTITTDYTVTGVLDPDGGTVVFVSGRSAGEIITIERGVAIERLTDFQQGGQFDPDVLNTEQDKQVAMIQELRRDLDRKLGLTATSTVVGANLKLTDDPEDGKILVWDGALGNVRNSVDTIGNIESDLATLAPISADITAVAAIDSDVTAVAADATDIGLVAGSIANVNTTATNIANVNTVAGGITNINTVAGVESDITTVAGIASDVTDAANNIPKANRTATTAPTVNDDSDDGYSEGSQWVDTTTDTVYFCADATAGAAVWSETGGVSSVNGNTGAVVLDTDDIVSGDTLTAVTVATDDKVLIQDTSDSDNVKSVTVQSIADLAAVSDATTTAKGVVEIATDAQALEGTDVGETGAFLVQVPSQRDGVELASGTFSSTTNAVIDFTPDDTTYARGYEVYVFFTVSTNDTEIDIRQNLNGTVPSTQYSFVSFGGNAAAYQTSVNQNSSGVKPIRSSGGQGINNNAYIKAYLKLYLPPFMESTTLRKQMNGELTYTSGNDTNTYRFGGGQDSNTNNLEGLRIIPDVGNITGNYIVKGLR